MDNPITQLRLGCEDPNGLISEMPLRFLECLLAWLVIWRFTLFGFRLNDVGVESVKDVASNA